MRSLLCRIFGHQWFPMSSAYFVMGEIITDHYDHCWRCWQNRPKGKTQFRWQTQLPRIKADPAAIEHGTPTLPLAGRKSP